MAGVADVITTIVDRQGGSDILRNPKTADNPVFALIGNTLGFGRGLLPNAGLLENRRDFEWEMGCISWQGATNEAGTQVGKSIKFKVNPKDVTWNMQQRSQEQKTKAGTVLHVWNDNYRKTYFDEPILTVNFQSGNILPSRDVLNMKGTLPEGLNNFYEFMALVDEVKVLPDGRANLCYIEYNSLIFPKIILWGFWTPRGIQFADSSDNPSQINSWTASFTVYKSFPELGRNISTRNESTIDGSKAGQQLQKEYTSRVGDTYRNRRSETFSLFQDIGTTVRGVLSGQVPPGAVAGVAKATANAASQRIVSRSSTALAGAVANQTAGTPAQSRAAGFLKSVTKLGRASGIF